MEILIPIGFGAIALGLLVFIAFKYGAAAAERKEAKQDAEMLKHVARKTGKPLPKKDKDVRDLMDG